MFAVDSSGCSWDFVAWVSRSSRLLRSTGKGHSMSRVVQDGQTS